MTKRRLEQYTYLKREIGLLEDQLARDRVVSDSVTGSSPHAPYTHRVVTITGIDVQTKERLDRRRVRLAKERAEIEAFVDKIQDSHMRMLIVLRYIEGMPWAQVAGSVGGGNTPDGVRKAIERFFA